MADKFNYSLDLDQIRDYMRLTVEDKLTWLEEIFLFSEEALSPAAKKIRDYFTQKTIIK